MLRWKFGVSQGLAIIALLGSSYFYATTKISDLFFNFACPGCSEFALWLSFTTGGSFCSHGAHLAPFCPGPDEPAGLLVAGKTKPRILILLVLAGGAAYAANASIKYAARQGFFDESENEKFIGQAQGDYGVLVGGRPETLVAIQAIRDSPIIGHGSFPYGLKYLQLENRISSTNMGIQRLG